jgi:hypothetical protein
MVRFNKHLVIGGLAVSAFSGASAFVIAPANALAQDVGAGSIRVHPNLATDSRERFIVCTGTAQNRALYGSKTTGTTGIVAFTEIPSGTSVVTTVSKVGFGGREQSWIVPGAGSTREVIIYMFTGSGGPLCPGVTVFGGSAPPDAAPPPPATSSAGITVQPGSSSGTGGFYVCVGTAQNRAAYGNGVTPASGPLSFVNLPGTEMIKATVVKSGYVGVERDWYPTPGQPVALTIPITAGSGGPFTCPGYAAPYAKEIRAAVNTSQKGEVRYQLPTAPAVRVLDQYNNPLQGISVAFSVTEGAGAITPASVVTGSDGIAQATAWSLGPNAGANEVAARTEGTSAPVRFKAIGVLVPKTITVVTTASQPGLTGTPVQAPPGVVVRDRNETPVPGARVSFTPRAGSGLASPTTVLTGADGIARLTSWTLGPIPGNHYLVAGATVAIGTMPTPTGEANVGFMANVLAGPTSEGTVSIAPRTPVAPRLPIAPPAPVTPPPPRLTEEILKWHGETNWSMEKKVLDCKASYGAKYVMVAIEGRAGEAIDKIRIGCSEVVQGMLDGTVKWTQYFGDDNFAAEFESRCSEGQAVVGIEGTILRTQMRSLLLRCRPIGVAGLASGSIARRTRVGGAGVPWLADDCTGGRPARALKLNQWRFYVVDKDVPGAVVSVLSLGSVIIAAPLVMSGGQLICEQPQL